MGTWPPPQGRGASDGQSTSESWFASARHPLALSARPNVRGLLGAGLGERSLPDGGGTLRRRESTARVWGCGRPCAQHLSDVSPGAAETPAQMAWPPLYVCVCLRREVCEEQLRTRTLGLRNPPGGQCPPRQEVSRRRAVLLTHRDERSPAQPASLLEQPLGPQMCAEDRTEPTLGPLSLSKAGFQPLPPQILPPEQTAPQPSRPRLALSRHMQPGPPHISVPDSLLPRAALLGEGSAFRGLGVIHESRSGKVLQRPPECGSSHTELAPEAWRVDKAPGGGARGAAWPRR